jgi:heme-degrading monooxygenase HmoA
LFIVGGAEHMPVRGSVISLLPERMRDMRRASKEDVQEISMFIAMNRFKVKKGSEQAFEKVWSSRESYLDHMQGFIEFHLLKGPEAEDHILYSSHTVWSSKASFEAWTKSEEFRKAHARAGNESTGPLYLEHPKFEGFEVRQTLLGSNKAA